MGNRLSGFLEDAKKQLTVSIGNKKIAKKKNCEINTENYNFGFAGHFKTGKSTFINAVRGLTKDDAGAAKVDVTECTDELACYECPSYMKLSFVRLYDIPGSGTHTHQASKYYEKKGLFMFNCLLIFTQNAIGKAEIQLASNAIKHRQKVAFVRSKCDMDMNNMLSDDKNIDENDFHRNERLYAKRLRRKIVNDFKKVINEQAPELNRIPLFVISSRQMLKFIREEIEVPLFQEPELLNFICSNARFDAVDIDRGDDEEVMSRY